MAMTDRASELGLTRDTVEAAVQATRARLLALWQLIHTATVLVGDSAALDPLAQYRDSPSPACGPGPPDLFWWLAEVWILSDAREYRSRQVELVIPFLREARAKAGRPVVRFGLNCAATVTETARQATFGVTTTCRECFGCSRLVQMVMDSYPWSPDSSNPAAPQRPDADLWEVSLVAQAAFGSPANLQGIWLRKPSPFMQRLLSWNPIPVFRAVQVQPLCRWLVNTYAGADVELAMRELELEYASLPPPKSPPRLIIDLETCSASLDGQTHTNVDPEGLQVLQKLQERAGEKIPTGKLCEEVGCSHETTLRRRLDRLPPPLRGLVKGQPGAGMYLQLPLDPP
jgi:hypothetical protein